MKTQAYSLRFLLLIIENTYRHVDRSFCNATKWKNVRWRHLLLRRKKRCLHSAFRQKIVIVADAIDIAVGSSLRST